MSLYYSIINNRTVVIGYVRLPEADRNLNLKNGFADHRQKGQHHKSNPEHLRRIIAAYKASKEVQSRAAPPFQIRGLWGEWISVNYKNLIGALIAEDILRLAELFENLFREQFTTGLGGYDDYVRYHTLMGGAYIRYLWCSYRNRFLALDRGLQELRFPYIGNPTGIMVGDSVISIDTFREAYNAVEMCELLKDVPQPVIVEIGGGIGTQVFQTIRMSGNRIAKYINFDIPEVAAISSYFLLAAFPDKCVRLFGEDPVRVAPQQNYDIAVLPHFAIADVMDSSVDLCYNSCSFSEMDSAASREYLAIIERICRKYFLHENHDTEFRFNNADGSMSVSVIGSRLIPDPARFKRIFKKPRLYDLPGDRSVYYEYLYERVHPAAMTAGSPGSRGV